MDPLSQGVLGAMAAQAAVKPLNLKKAHFGKALIIGALAGMAPDLDVLIGSDVDSLLTLEYHRQFTHALAFIPVGGFICAVIFYLLFNRWWHLSFKSLFIMSTLGYATHGLLDSCTSYGTQLLWPFTNYRVSWDIISIIDPVFTLPLLFLVLATVIIKKPVLVHVAIVWMCIYFAIGVTQHNRAINVGEQIIASRGHQVLRLEVKPSFANLIVWKIVYETDDHYYVDAVKLGWFDSHIWEGDHVKKLDVDRDLPWLDKASQQAKDIERFRWFSAGFVSRDLKNPYKVVDMRYSSLPNQVKPLWGIRLSPQANESEHVQFYAEPKDNDSDFSELWKMIWN